MYVGMYVVHEQGAYSSDDPSSAPATNIIFIIYLLPKVGRDEIC